MEFRLATAADQQGVESLWHYCFEHREDPFFQYYFTKAYQPQHTLIGVTDEGAVDSMVHMRPVTVSVRGHAMDTSYLIGVATAPAARGTGVGKSLLATCLRTLRNAGQPFSILMPSQAGFYQPYGWGLYAHQWFTTLSMTEVRDLYTREQLQTVSQSSMTALPKEQPWRQAYVDFTKTKTGYVVRRDADWTLLQESLAAEDMQIAWVTEAGTCTGYMIYHIADDTFRATEFVTLTLAARATLFGFMYQHRSQASQVSWNEYLGERSYLDWSNGKQGHQSMPFMMARIHDIQAAMTAIPVANNVAGTVTIAVTDRLLSEQTGIYQATMAPEATQISVKRLANAEAYERDVNQADVAITERGLSQLLLGGRSVADLVYQGEMSIQCPEAADLLAAWYPVADTFINEWW